MLLLMDYYKTVFLLLNKMKVALEVRCQCAVCWLNKLFSLHFNQLRTFGMCINFVRKAVFSLWEDERIIIFYFPSHQPSISNLII